MNMTPRTRLVALVVLLVLILAAAIFFRNTRPRPAPDLPPAPTSLNVDNGPATTEAVPGPINVVAAKAIWLDAGTIAWHGVTGSSYKLLFDPDGGVMSAAEGTACLAAATVPCYVPLTAEGTVSGYPKNPNATGLTPPGHRTVCG